MPERPVSSDSNRLFQRKLVFFHKKRLFFGGKQCSHPSPPGCNFWHLSLAVLARWICILQLGLIPWGLFLVFRTTRGSRRREEMGAEASFSGKLKVFFSWTLVTQGYVCAESLNWCWIRKGNRKPSWGDLDHSVARVFWGLKLSEASGCCVIWYGYALPFPSCVFTILGYSSVDHNTIMYGVILITGLRKMMEQRLGWGNPPEVLGVHWCCLTKRDLPPRNICWDDVLCDRSPLMTVYITLST